MTSTLLQDFEKAFQDDKTIGLQERILALDMCLHVKVLYALIRSIDPDPARLDRNERILVDIAYSYRNK